MSVLDLFRLDGKTAIVTGGGRGLGAQMAQTFAEVGANVVVCSRKLGPCEQMRDQLKEEYGVDALAFTCDVSNRDDVKKVVQGTVDYFAGFGGGGTDPRYMDTIGYNTSKGAIMTFTKDLATKWGRYNINVNAIAPGFFPTKMSQGLLDIGKDKIIEDTPLNRLGTDQDIKGAALFLASSASDYVSGDILSVDGGAHAY